jgi:hypothetical protein
MQERAGTVRRLRVSPALPGTIVMLVFDAARINDPVLTACRRLVIDAAAQARRMYVLAL